MLTMCKEEYDRLMETSPSINEQIIRLFNNKFPVKKIEPKEEEAEINRPDIMRPEICDELVSTAEILFVTPIVSDTNLGQPSLMDIVRNKNKIMAGYEKEVRDWSDKFEEKHNRKPLEEEILDNLQDKMNPDILMKIVKKLIDEFENSSDEEDPINKL
jgi:uncharacterized protein YeeX (DUF496 family)